MKYLVLYYLFFLFNHYLHATYLDHGNIHTHIPVSRPHPLDRSAGGSLWSPLVLCLKSIERLKEVTKE